MSNLATPPLVPSYVRRVRQGQVYVVCVLKNPRTQEPVARGWALRTNNLRNDRARALRAARTAYRDGPSEPPRLNARRQSALANQAAVHLAPLFGPALCGATPEASVPTTVWQRDPAWVEHVLARWHSELCSRCRVEAEKFLPPLK